MKDAMEVRKYTHEEDLGRMDLFPRRSGLRGTPEVCTKFSYTNFRGLKDPTRDCVTTPSTPSIITITVSSRDHGLDGQERDRGKGKGIRYSYLSI